MNLCYCGSNLKFADCCEPHITGKTPAPNAEGLVRARYSAFVVKNLDYIDRTHAPEVRMDFNRGEAERLAEECEWVDLKIHNSKEVGDHAEVEFVIRFRHRQQVVTKAALSRFRREQDEWYFVSSKPAQHLVHKHTIKLGRNDPCHCNSGKKYKKCCGPSAEMQGA